MNAGEYGGLERRARGERRGVKEVWEGWRTVERHEGVDRKDDC